jgi:ribosome biogenesis protein ALB1
MPSKNSINKPKDNLIRQRKSHLASKRRQRRAIQNVTIVKQSNGSTAIIPLNSTRSNNGVITNTVISKKKAKKLERNLKYAQLRRENNSNSNKKDVEMTELVDDNNNNNSKENPYRKALWNVVEEANVKGGVVLTAAFGEGTTLGSASF